MSTHKKANKLDVLDDKSGQTVTPCEPTFEEIRERAYEVYLQRGQIDRFDVEDWLQAEKELRQNQRGLNAGRTKFYVNGATAELARLEESP